MGVNFECQVRGMVPIHEMAFVLAEFFTYRGLLLLLFAIVVSHRRFPLGGRFIRMASSSHRYSSSAIETKGSQNLQRLPRRLQDYFIDAVYNYLYLYRADSEGCYPTKKASKNILQLEPCRWAPLR
ncbi:hypothetical protein KP509_1Z010000 [Ceratopteris richardii]|nr:hypothetical protein KP509_1Z010000 [Ceratopteris richardii]